jgi:Dolichyl-phosphate-mannose-protein mannosyltransferase
VDSQVIIETITVPALPETVVGVRSQATPAARWLWLEDRWAILTLFSAVTIGVGGLLYYSMHHDLLLYSDSHSHLDIARSVVDSVSPGLAQLGGVWLPLPHLLMLPLIWNNTLWRTGLAGSIPSLICYVTAAVYLYLAAHRLTGDGRASFVGTLAFLINPNVVYLQATPLSEMTLFAAIAAACYYLLAWSERERLSDLVAAACATILSTLARYEGWAVFAAAIVIVVVICLRKGYSWRKTQGIALFYALVGGMGPALWLLWCLIILGDPLYFQHSQYSPQSQQLGYIHAGLDPMYHNVYLSLRNLLWLSGETIGPVLLGVLALAVVRFLIRSRLTPKAIAACAFLVPTMFYGLAYYTGQAIMFAPHAAPAAVGIPFFNARYGVSIVAPLAIFLATLSQRWPLGQLLLVVVIIGQTIATAQGGIVSLQDGQFGISCFRYTQVPVYLAQHYDGGYILNDTYHTAQDYIGAGIDLHNVVYQGSGTLWQKALANPGRYVDWVVVLPGDQVDQRVSQEAAFHSEFALVLQDPVSRVYLYHRNGLPALPTRTLPPNLLRNDYALCP